MLFIVLNLVKLLFHMDLNIKKDTMRKINFFKVNTRHAFLHLVRRQYLRFQILCSEPVRAAIPSQMAMVVRVASLSQGDQAVCSAQSDELTRHNNDNNSYSIKIEGFMYMYLFNPSAQAGCDTKSIFKWSLTDFNSKSSFSLTGCHTWYGSWSRLKSSVCPTIYSLLEGE